MFLPIFEWIDCVTSRNLVWLRKNRCNQLSDVDNGTWKNANDILARQVSLGRQLQGDGFIFYSYDYLNNPHTKQEVENVMKVL